MTHRYSAYGLFVVIGLLALRAPRAADSRVAAGARMGFLLLVSQIVLGVCNVLLGTPAWLSSLHASAAAAILALMVVTTFRLARLQSGTPALAPALEGAR